jgi:hypothetical protein
VEVKRNCNKMRSSWCEWVNSSCVYLGSSRFRF